MPETANNTVKKILLVADYGKDDLAFYEVVQQLYEQAKRAGLPIAVDTVSVGKFDTAQTAAVVAQAVESGEYDLVYHNTAPRNHIKSALPDNAGEFLGYAEYVKKGKSTRIVGVDSGDADSVNTFALLKASFLRSLKSELTDDWSHKVYKVACSDKGSQFRSRDIFVSPVIDALKGNIELEQKIEIPKPSEISRGGMKQLETLNREAMELLEQREPQNQLARHGDAEKAYVTVIGPHDVPKASHALLDNVAAKCPGAEVDLMPLATPAKDSQDAPQEPWVEAAFSAAQLALNSGYDRLNPENSLRMPNRTVIVLDKKGGTLENADKLYVAKLDNGAAIVASNPLALACAKGRIAGDVMSYEKQDRHVSLNADGSVAVSGAPQVEDISNVRLPASDTTPPGITLVRPDAYGNLKLGTFFGDFLCDRLGIKDSIIPAGESHSVDVSLNNLQERGVKVAAGLFAVEKGQLVIYPGSSGWAPKFGEAKRFLTEITVRGTGAAEKFGNPMAGQYVRVASRIPQAGSPGQVVDGDQRTCEDMTTDRAREIP